MGHSATRRRYAGLALGLATGLAALMLLAACNRFVPNVPFLQRNQAEVTPVGLTVFAPADDADLRTAISATVSAALTGDPAISPTITVTSLSPRVYQQLLAGRHRPDVLVLNLAQVDELIAAEQLAPLALSPELTAGLDPQLLRAGTRDGILYCAPHSFQTLALFYNRDLFDQAEIPYPDRDWTWRDLRTAADAIDGLPTVRFMPFGLTLSPDISRWLPFLLQASPTPPLDDPSSFFQDSAALDEGLVYVTGLYSDTLAATPGYFSAAWAGEAFGNGRAAMTVEGNWLVPYLAEQYPELRYGIAELPQGRGEATVAFALCVAAGADTSAPQLVQRALSALLRSELHPSAIPAHRERWPEWAAANPGGAPFLSQAENSALWAGPWVEPQHVDEYQSLIRGLLDGDLSRAEVIDALSQLTFE